MRAAPPAVVFAALAILSSVACAWAATPMLHGRPRAWQPPAASVSAGMRAAIDPVSGELVPIGPGDVGMSAAARAQARRDTPVYRRADGSGYAVLGPAFRAYVVVHIAPDGQLVEDCVQSASEAIARVNATSAAPAGKGR